MTDPAAGLVKAGVTETPQLAGESKKTPKSGEIPSQAKEDGGSVQDESLNVDEKASQKEDVNRNPLTAGSADQDNDSMDTGADAITEPSKATDLQDLEKEDWYHGCLPFEDIVGLLKANGDFLIRELEPEGDRMAMVISWEILQHHIRPFHES
ncbi:hypothetical protein KIN20_001221 [Parelaphostrongylus tenuis]|uniref:SH2 domain-containing protein n=1 Tax=Parelaphostrongylus tenuis TaxID=148309 RepID=A0AAD5LTD0_PARTN|nr:hypothetical protein KIN20_001221 [Parelaphostrongylus tenuis]